MPFRRSSRAAFTLLEVILALGLSALLLGALAIAIQTSLKATYSGRADVAQAQLARAALERIGNDVRAAVWYEQPDPASMVVPPAVSSLAPTSSSSAPSSSGPTQASSVQSVQSVQSVSSAGGSSGGGSSGSSGSSRSGGSSSSGSSSGGSSGGSGGGSSSSSGGSSSGSSSTDPNATTPVPPQMPMFIGGQNWLQFDISHLPRQDQYMYMMQQGTSQGGAANAGYRDRISEMKTVFYFLAGSGQSLPPGMSAGNMSAGASGGANQGLMRREADRAVTLWSSSGGGSGSTGQNLEALAPEITSLSFQYFNGASWSTMWDSRTYGCLPRAVEIRITLAVDPTQAASAKNRGPQSGGSAQQAQYVLRVPIAAWRPPNLQLLNSMANSTQSGASGSSSSTSGGAGGSGSF